MRRGGRTRGRGRNQTARLKPIQPLMSENIQNIDLELELLRQKREMIEQHQLMLENQKMYEQQRRYESGNTRYYEQASYDSPGPSRSEPTYARFYDDPVVEDYIPLNSGRKRAANADWPRGSSPKRFSSRRGNVAKSFGARLGPKPNPHTPRPSHDDFRPGPAPKLSGKAKIPPKKTVVDEEFMLRPDCDPSRKVRGRLEFAFGSIFKQMKENFSNSEFNVVLIHNPYAQMLKAAIRERIRSLMMNKFVAHGDAVLTMYRKKYSIESDKTLLRKVRKDINTKTANVLPLNEDVIAAPINPVNYIKYEMGKVMDAELNEIMRKLEIINNPKLTESQKEKRLAKESVEVTSVEENENDNEQVKLWKREVHKKIRQKIPHMLIKNVPLILKFLSLDLVYINTWTALMSKTNNTEGGVHKLEVGIEGETAFAPKYCAKVRGHPKLPPKIRQFLEPFKPMWVRKHRMVRNLVYVSFRDRAGLEQLLQKNGTDFGDCFLRIHSIALRKESNGNKLKAKSKTPKKTRRSVAYKAAKDAANQSNDQLNISSDLDNQINDLLSSIRQAEEEETDLNQAMIELDPETIIKDENDVNTKNEINVPTEDNKEFGEQNAKVNKINEQSDDTAQNNPEERNTVTEVYKESEHVPLENPEDQSHDDATENEESQIRDKPEDTDVENAGVAE